MNRDKLREKAVLLRGSGKSYSEIEKILGTHIPKGTLSYWCKNVLLPPSYLAEKKQRNQLHIKRIQALAVKKLRAERLRHLYEIFNRNLPLGELFKSDAVAKISLAILYMGEGAKNPRMGRIGLGNSDPVVIKLFLNLLRRCYQIDESKFRCTVMARADQNLTELDQHWSEITGIPLNQFYRGRIDSRTIGKPTKKLNYQGVCSIDYFSAAIFKEIMLTIQVINSVVVSDFKIDMQFFFSKNR